MIIIIESSNKFIEYYYTVACSGESISPIKVAEESLSKVIAIVKESMTKESTMLGLFRKKEDKEYVISAGLEGVLAKNGKPLANTNVVRRVYWNGNDEGVVDLFKSDEKGYFEIPAFKVKLQLSSMAEFVGKIELFASSEIAENFFWYTVKRSAEINADFDEPLESVFCDLSNPEITVEMKDFPALTRCRWLGMSPE